MKHRNTEITERMLLDSGIPKAYWKLDASTYKGNARVLRQLEAYIRSYDEMRANAVGVRILGPVQTYKTFLLTHLLKNAMVRFQNVRYLTLDQATQICLEGEIESLLEEDLLALDEVNHTRQDFPKEVFVRIIRMRRNADLPTAFASRFEVHELKEHYSEDATGLTEDFVTLRTKANPFAVNPARANLKKGIEDVK